jgi:hypothetical protein
VLFKINGTNPVSFGLKSAHKVAADEATGAINKYSFHEILRIVRYYSRAN